MSVLSKCLDFSFITLSLYLLICFSSPPFFLAHSHISLTLALSASKSEMSDQNMAPKHCWDWWDLPEVTMLCSVQTFSPFTQITDYSRVPTRHTSPASEVLWVRFGERIRPAGLLQGLLQGLRKSLSRGMVTWFLSMLMFVTDLLHLSVLCFIASLTPQSKRMLNDCVRQIVFELIVMTRGANVWA